MLTDKEIKALYKDQIQTLCCGKRIKFTDALNILWAKMMEELKRDGFELIEASVTLGIAKKQLRDEYRSQMGLK